MVLEPGSIVFCYSQAERRHDCTPQEGHSRRAGISNFRQFLPLHRVEVLPFPVSKLLHRQSGQEICTVSWLFVTVTNIQGSQFVKGKGSLVFGCCFILFLLLLLLFLVIDAPSP